MRVTLYYRKLCSFFVFFCFLLTLCNANDQELSKKLHELEEQLKALQKTKNDESSKNGVNVDTPPNHEHEDTLNGKHPKESAVDESHNTQCSEPKKDTQVSDENTEDEETETSHGKKESESSKSQHPTKDNRQENTKNNTHNSKKAHPKHPEDSKKKTTPKKSEENVNRDEDSNTPDSKSDTNTQQNPKN